MHVDESSWWRSSLTPLGPATVRLDLRGGTPVAEAWGPGAGWILEQVPAMLGDHDPGHRFEHGPAALLDAQRRRPDLRIGASGTLYHDLLVTVLGQRITSVEAFAQWRRLVDALGRPAPGPLPGLRLPPDPEVLAGRPPWWFHPLGIEEARARTLQRIARIGDRIHTWVERPSHEVDRLLASIPGVGPWTRGVVLGISLGDPDAVPVGDFHLRHTVVHAFTGRPRGSDEEMLALLAPFAPQRGRVIRLLQADGIAAPRLGPRRRIEPIARR